MKNWLLVYSKDDAVRARRYGKKLQEIGEQNGMSISDPMNIEIENDEPETCSDALRTILNEKVFSLFFLQNEKKLFPVFLDRFCFDRRQISSSRSLQSDKTDLLRRNSDDLSSSENEKVFSSSKIIFFQIVLRSTIDDEQVLPNVVLNIVRDVNFRMGGEFRSNHINLVRKVFKNLPRKGKNLGFCFLSAKRDFYRFVDLDKIER